EQERRRKSPDTCYLGAHGSKSLSPGAPSSGTLRRDCVEVRMDAEPVPVEVATLPRFSNTSPCAKCGRRRPIRVPYDPGVRGCRPVVGGPHFPRLCPCGHEWIER